MTRLIKQYEAAKESFQEHQQALKRPVGLSGTPTGFYDWDMVIGGWRPRKVNTIAMRSAMGKSATMVQMSKAAAEVVDGRRSELLIASWEQAASEIITRYVSWKTGFTIDQLNHPYIFTPTQLQKITEAYTEASKFPVHYHQYSTNIDTIVKMLDEFMAMVKGKEITEGNKIQPVFVLDYIGMAKGRTK
jgi:replicative DNA helicase